MEKHEKLTNEKLKEKFSSQFDLVNYAIRIAEDMIITGREPRVNTEELNRAYQVLLEISQGKDQLPEEIEEQDAAEV